MNVLNIPEEALKGYVKANLIKEYDLSVKLREQHDREVKKKRERRG